MTAAAATIRTNLPTVGALIRRSANELLRVPGAAIPGVLAPAIFFVGLTAVFGGLTQLGGFGTDEYQSFLLPVTMIQGAGFTGAATGVNLARDIEQGWFDRLLASPAPRPAILAGLVLSASMRALVPATFLLVIALALGAHWPGVPGLIVTFVAVMGMGTVAALWGCGLALKYRSQSAAPLMQAGMFILTLMTVSYAPKPLLQEWMQVVATINPTTQVLQMSRQGFLTGEITWANTWPGLVAIAGMAALFYVFAERGMRRMAD